MFSLQTIFGQGKQFYAWILTIPAAGGIAYGLLRLLEVLGLD